MSVNEINLCVLTPTESPHAHPLNLFKINTPDSEEVVPRRAYLLSKLTGCLNLSECSVVESKLSLTTYIMSRVCRFQWKVSDQDQAFVGQCLCLCPVSAGIRDMYSPAPPKGFLRYHFNYLITMSVYQNSTPELHL